MNQPVVADGAKPAQTKWLTRTVFGIGVASLLSDWSHEIATAILPAFLAGFGAAAAWLGIIEGVSDGLSSFAKMASGYYTDQLRRRKPIAVAGYVVTAVATSAMGLAMQAWHVLVCRSMAWLGRGVRTPVRKALLAGGVDPSAYGRAFGFERMMDTVGAIVGPLSAAFLLTVLDHRLRAVLLLTVIPGLLAAAAIGFLVKEVQRAPVPHVSFGARFGKLPAPFRRFLVAVGVFGAGDFAHSMLILLARQKLAEPCGAEAAATWAISLYVLHNVLYASFAFVAGWLADRFDKRLLLAGAYGLAGVTGLILVFADLSLPILTVVFILAGIFVAAEEALEDSLAAELVDKEHHGMGFGLLATVNGVGDLISSAIVGLLWTMLSSSAAFAYSTVLFFAGALLVLRTKKPTH
jgi:MFS family permease